MRVSLCKRLIMAGLDPNEKTSKAGWKFIRNTFPVKPPKSPSEKPYSPFNSLLRFVRGLSPLVIAVYLRDENLLLSLIELGADISSVFSLLLIFQ